MEERDREGIAIVKCKGRLVLGEESEAFRDRTRALIQEGKYNIILNLALIDRIDSSGLGELISLHRDLQTFKGKVLLVELKQETVDLLVITKLTTVFDVFDDEQDAVNSFFPDRQVPKFDLLDFVHEIKAEKQ